MYIKKIIIVLFLLLSCNLSFGADYCVLPTGAGAKTGADWNNAIDWSTISSTGFKRGSTYWLGGGTYAIKTLSTATSGTTYIYIKKATAGGTACNSSTAGWDASYGTHQAIVTGSTSAITLTTGYWDIDGVTGGGSSNGALYGIKLALNGTAAGVELSCRQADITGLSVKNVWFSGFAASGRLCPYGITHSVTQTVSNIYLGHNLFDSNVVQIAFYRASNVTIAYNYFTANGSTSSCHGEQLTAGGTSNNWLIYGNTFYNSLVGGVVLHDCAGCGGSGYNTGWKVYNNLFIGVIGGNSVTMGVVDCADSGSSHPDIMRDFEVHHNTIINMTGHGYGAGIGHSCYQTGAHHSVTAYNNLFYNTWNPPIANPVGGGYGLADTTIHDYNAFYYCTGGIVSENNMKRDDANHNPFTSSSEPYDLHLNSTYHSALHVSNPLPSPYNVDYDGAARSSTAPNAGAYEYSGSKSY